MREKVHFPQCQVSDMFEFSYSIIFLCSQNQRKTTRNSLVFGWSAFSYLRPHLSRVWAAPGFASAVIARQPFYGSPVVLLLNLLPLHYLLVQLLPLMHYILPLNYLLLPRSCCSHKVAHRGPWAMQCSVLEVADHCIKICTEIFLYILAVGESLHQNGQRIILR